MRPTLNILVTLSLIVLADSSCIHRDPYVRLPMGYAISANSRGSTCSLYYESEMDERSYSDSYASCGEDTETGDVEYYILCKGGDVSVFRDEDEWYTELRRRNVSPSFFFSAVENVKSYAANAENIIGECAGGYYMVDISNNRIYFYSLSAEWRSAISDNTSLSSAKMVNPKSFFAQTRSPVSLVFYAAVSLAVFVVSLWRSRTKRTAGTESPEE